MNAASQEQVLPTIGEFLAAVGATPAVVYPEYPGVPVVLLDIPEYWHEVVREVLPMAFGAWAFPAEEGSVSAESGWVENAVLMVWRLSRPVDPRAVMRCAFTDSRRLPDWRELGADAEDYDGFPSAEISGTYSYAGLSLWMSTRYVIASTPTGQYLLQLTVTTFADDIEDGLFIAESFTVTVPPARPGPGAHDPRIDPPTGPQPLPSGPGFTARHADSAPAFESFPPDSELPGHTPEFDSQPEPSAPDPESADRRPYSASRPGLYDSGPGSPSGRQDSWFEEYAHEPKSPAPAPDSVIPDSEISEQHSAIHGLDSSSSGMSNSWPEASILGSDSVIRGFEPPYTESSGLDRESAVGVDSQVTGPESALTGAHSVTRGFEPPVTEPESRPRSHAARAELSEPDSPISRSDTAHTGAHSAVRDFQSPLFDSLVSRSALFGDEGESPRRGVDSRERGPDSVHTGSQPVAAEFESPLFDSLVSRSASFDTEDLRSGFPDSRELESDSVRTGSHSLAREFDPRIPESSVPRFESSEFRREPFPLGTDAAVREFESPNPHSAPRTNWGELPRRRRDSETTGASSGIGGSEPWFESSTQWSESLDVGGDSAVYRDEPTDPGLGPVGTGAHSVVRGFESTEFETDSWAVGFESPGQKYESYGGVPDLGPDGDELPAAGAYSAIMGIEPPPVGAGDHAVHQETTDEPGAGNMDFRI